MLLWEIHYADGTVVTNLEATRKPDGRFNLPSGGVLGIINHDHRKGQARLKICAKSEIYTLERNKFWYGRDSVGLGLLLYLQNNIGSAAVLFGEMVENDIWQDWNAAQFARGAKKDN